MNLRRRVMISTLMCLSISILYGQGLTINSGSHMVVRGNVAVVVQDGNLIIDGTHSAGTGTTIYMKGNVADTLAKIGGNNPSFNQLVIDKSSNGVQIETNLVFFPSTSLQMLSGDLNLNGKDIFLFHGATLLSESESSRIKGNSGRVMMTTNLNAPNNVNPGNIGLTLTSTDNLGTITIQRIHQAQAINGSSSIDRHYKIDYFNTGLTVGYTFDYFDNELNGLDETYLEPWKMLGDWQQVGAFSKDTMINSIVVTGASTTSDTLWAFSSGKIQISPKILLQGNYAGSGLMTDHLRTGGLIPISEPYSSLGYTHIGGGGEVIDPSILNVTGDNAIVDWVFLELRDKTNSTSVLATRSALLQKDGDIVDVDGISPVGFSGVATDDYYLAVRHRNHLGVRSAIVQNITPSAGSLDFTSSLTQAFDNSLISTNDAMVDLGSGVYGLIGGNANGNTNVRATGPPFINDFSTLLNTLGGATNILSSQYALTDLNMDGTIRATGPPFINDFSKLLSILGASTAILNTHLD